MSLLSLLLLLPSYPLLLLYDAIQDGNVAVAGHGHYQPLVLATRQSLIIDF